MNNIIVSIAVSPVFAQAQTRAPYNAEFHVFQSPVDHFSGSPLFIINYYNFKFPNFSGSACFAGKPIRGGFGEQLFFARVV